MENKSQAFTLGDIIGVDHGYYQHFGIYIGDQEVIHYYDLKDAAGKISIQVSGYDTFLENEEECFVCDFEEFLHPPDKLMDVKEKNKSLHRLLEPKLNLGEEFVKECAIYMAFQTGRYKIYTPEETVKRAYERLGETVLEWKRSNCEHFAIWCKTGIVESSEANALIKVLRKNWIRSGSNPAL